MALAKVVYPRWNNRRQNGRSLQSIGRTGP
jgi:hypothetical protein